MIEDVEIEEVEASHLRRVRCSICGAMTLAAPGHEQDARCGLCMMALAGELSAGRGVAGYTTGVGFPVGEAPVVEVVRPVHPAPQVVEGWRPEAFEGAPAVVGKLGELAMEAGWQVRWSHAVGTGVHGSTGKPTSVQERYSVRFGRHPLGVGEAVAVYCRAGGSWSWGSMWVWGPARPHFGLPTLADLQGWLREGGAVEAEWYAAVTEREAVAMQAEADQKEALKSLKSMSVSEGLSLADICRFLGLELEIEQVGKAISGSRGKVREGAS